MASIAEAARRRVPAPDLRPQEKERGRRASNDDPPAVLADAPITPLGVQGDKLWLLDSLKQLRLVSPDCRKGDVQLWFGGDEYLTAKFPQYGKGDPPPIVGFNQSHVQTAIVKACVQRGIFSPQGRVFGRGAHRSRDGQLVLHLGGTVLVAGLADKRGAAAPVQEYPAGRLGTMLYPALPDLPAPAIEPSGHDDAKALLELFGDWKWVEPDASPLLLLGMVAQMFICGALEWRSHMWLAGPTASGKTTLQDLIRAIHDDWCLHTADASEAAVRQVLNDDTLPVLIDEAEADDNPDKQQAILNLAKKASSGDKILRGSSDHQAKEFTAQSCFLFSSVLHSLKKGEERNRVAILEMRSIPAALPAEDGHGSEWHAPDLQHWRQLGRRMHKRMIDQWPRFRDTLADYRREIASHGLESRWQDTYGTLLACADCLLYDDVPTRVAFNHELFGREKRWVQRVLPMMLKTKSEARTDVERCIAHLMSRVLPGAHGAAPEPVGQWVHRAMEIGDPELGGPNETARNRLKAHGLRVVRLKPDRARWKFDGEPAPLDWEGGWLAVAYPTNDALADLFKGTEWAKGVWLQSLGKVEGAATGLRIRFNPMGSDNAIAIPLKALRGEEG